jgi:hypothetical protein
LRKMGLGHFDVVAKDLVVADLERADARPLPFAALELGDEALARAADRAQVVELGVPAVLDDAAPRRRRPVEDGLVGEGDVAGVVPSAGRPEEPGREGLCSRSMTAGR